MAVEKANPVWAANIKLVNDAVQRDADQAGIKVTDVSQVQEWAQNIHHTAAGYGKMADLGLQSLGLRA